MAKFFSFILSFFVSIFMPFPKTTKNAEIVTVSPNVYEERMEKEKPTTKTKTKKSTGQKTNSKVVVISDIVYDICDNYYPNVQPALVFAVIETESDFNIYCDNGTAVGLMQLNRKYMGNYGLTEDNCFEPEANIKAGTQILSGLLKRYSLTDALICYNCGEYGAKKYLGGSTWYSRTVISRMSKYQ